jgi:hypothetical protein
MDLVQYAEYLHSTRECGSWVRFPFSANVLCAWTYLSILGLNVSMYNMQTLTCIFTKIRYISGVRSVVLILITT